MDSDTNTIIIGAGPAGLAVGAVLRRAKVPFVMLERAARIGDSWHRHYDRLHLHTPKSHSALPHHAYPRAYPRYPSRQQFVEYLDDYARTFALEPEFVSTACFTPTYFASSFSKASPSGPSVSQKSRLCFAIFSRVKPGVIAGAPAESVTPSSFPTNEM